MEQLRDARQEKFCQIIALEDCDVAEAAFRAGYGDKSHPTRDNYHTMQGYRLMEKDYIQERIASIRRKLNEDDKETSAKLIEWLMTVVFSDYARYTKSSNMVLPNGRTVTDYYLATPIQDWDQKFRSAVVVGFNSNGTPIFADVMQAWDRLAKIYGLMGKDMSDIEDMMRLFVSAGLPVGNGIQMNGIQANTKEDIEKELE